MNYLDQIRNAIKKSEKTQSECAADMGITPQYLGDLLAGNASLSIRVACALEKHFKLNALKLLRGKLDADLSEYRRRQQGAAR